MKKLLFVLCLGFCPPLFASVCESERLFTHEMGQICIAEKPKRIVVLEYSFLDQMGILGIKPIAYARDAMPAYLEQFAESSTNIGSRKMPNLEKITALKPDLIIADRRLHTNTYAQLSAIAPTIIRNGMRGGIEDQFATLRQVSQIVGETEVAEKAIESTHNKIAEISEIANAKTAVVGVFRAGSISAHGNDSFLGSLIESLGKNVPLKTRGGSRQYYIDLEGLASVNPDSIVFMCSSDAQGALDDMLKKPLFRALKAVKNKNLYIVPKVLWSKGRGILGINEILDSALSTGFLKHVESTELKCLE